MWNYTNKDISEILKPISFYKKESLKYKDSFYEEIREKITNSFKDLIFEEKEHKYFLHDKKLISVSHICEIFSEKQDFDLIAKRSAIKLNMDWNILRNQWLLKGNIATYAGSFDHGYGEGLFNIYLGREDLIPKDNLININGEYFSPLSPKQKAITKFFYDSENMREVPLLAEVKMYKEDWNISGTFDLLQYSTEKEGIIMYDYKTNEGLEKTFFKPCFAPFDDLNSCSPLTHYIFQQNIYKILLENIGIFVKEMYLIWLKDNGTYELVKIKDISSELKKVLPIFLKNNEII